jgi:glutathione peroxidase
MSLPHPLPGKNQWNFSKFLIKDGKPIKRYGPTDAPLGFEKDIQAALSS